MVVAVKYGSTGEIAATLVEEGENTPADVFLAQDPAGLGAVAAAGILAVLDDSILERVPDWARSHDSLWVGISGRARTVVYNTENVDPSEMPATLEGFIDPVWRGRIGWAPTNGSFQAMVTAMRVEWGRGQGQGTGLLECSPTRPRSIPATPPSLPPPLPVRSTWDSSITTTCTASWPKKARTLMRATTTSAVVGPGSMVMVAGAAILDDAANRNNADLFLEFMLSAVAQQYFAGQTHEYPLVEGVTISRPDNFPGRD